MVRSPDLASSAIGELAYQNGTFASPNGRYSGPALIGMDSFYNNVWVMPLNFSRNVSASPCVLCCSLICFLSSQEMGTFFILAQSNLSQALEGESYKAFAFGTDGDLYVVRTFLVNFVAMAHFMRFDTLSGNLIFAVEIPSTSNDISLGPDGYFYVTQITPQFSQV